MSGFTFGIGLPTWTSKDRKIGEDDASFRERAMKAQLDAYSSIIQANKDFAIYPYFQTSRKEKEAMLEKLKGLKEGRFGALATVEELMELAAYARSLVAEYETQGVPAPKWLQEVIAPLARQVQVRHQAALEGELRKAERELEELRSQEEKRAAKEKEVEALRKALAGAP